MDNDLISVTPSELTRLQDCERAWYAVFDALLRGNPEAFSHPTRIGTECALAEIGRLQILAKSIETTNPVEGSNDH